MPTNGEVYQQLKTTEVGLSLPDAKGQQRMLYLPDCASIVAFKKLTKSNEEIQSLVAKSGNGIKVTPNSIEEYTDINLNVDASVFTDPNQESLPFKSEYMFVGLNCAARKKAPNSDGDWGQFHDMEQKTPTYNFAFMTNSERFRGSYITDILKNTIDSISANIETDYFVKEETKNPGLFLDDSQANITRLALKAYPKYVKRYEKELVKSPDDNSISVDNGKVINSYVRDLSVEGADKFVPSAEAYEAVVKNNQDKYRKSAALFVKECQIIQPNHLIVLGKTAQTIVRNMRAAGLFDTDPEVAQLADNLIESQHYSKQGKGSATVDFMAYLQTLLKKTDDDIVNS